MPSGLYRRPRSKSGLKGVIYSNGARGKPLSKPWKCYIRHHGLYQTIGYFETKEEAAKAYDEVALRLYGPETYLNSLPARS